MKLTDTYIRTLKPKAKRYKSRRERGLFVWVMPNDSKLWYLGYTHAGKERVLSLGAYPAVSIADARERRSAANRLLVKGIDPGEQRKADRQAQAEADSNTFKVTS
ncbi:MAG TPA: Arm DNA-binding domain-containing protein [Solimonas sp.]|nr:Arm DNA-binding domain-containing protein [Solimonas sp.]